MTFAIVRKQCCSGRNGVKGAELTRLETRTKESDVHASVDGLKAGMTDAK